MTAISNLAKEITEEYQSLTGMRVTAKEYLSFRKQALKEAKQGYLGTNTQISASPQPICVTRVKEDMPAPISVKQPIKLTTNPANNIDPEEDPFFALCNSID